MPFDPSSPHYYRVASPRTKDHPPQIASPIPLNKVHPDSNIRLAQSAIDLALSAAATGSLNMFAAHLRNAAKYATQANEAAREVLLPDDETEWRRLLLAEKA